MKQRLVSGTSTVYGRLRTNLRESARVDTRTLAVFRVFVGVLVVVDMLLRSRNFNYFYTDEGVIPLWLAVEATSDTAFSIYFFSGDPTVTAFLFVLHALVAVQLIVGYKTRLATVLVFLFVVSLDHRAPFVTSYADTLFRLLLFWAIFLPLGERWSVDAVHRDREARESFVGVASAAILLQMVYMYFVNGYHKARNELWTSGEATPLIMGLDDITFFLGDTVVRHYPTLLTYGGLIWFYMLLFSWLLFVLVGRKRMILAAMFAGVHASFAITVRIGAFPYVALAGLLPFLQSQFWDDAGKVARFVGVEPSHVYGRVSSLEKVAHVFPNVRLDSPDVVRARSAAYTLAMVVVVAAIVVASFFMYPPVDEASPVSPDEHIEGVAERFSVDQPTWSVFAPNPRTTDRYYVFPAKTDDGEHLDLYNDRELTFDRPYDRLHKQYDTYRHRFYMNDIRRAARDGRNRSPEVLSEYLCEKHSDDDTEITHVNMWYVTEDVEMDSIDDHERRERLTFSLYEHGCANHEPMEIDRPPFNLTRAQS